MQLWRITYLSVSTVCADELEDVIQNICDVAARHNPRAGITGILTFHTGNFAQILEGSERELRELMSRIAADQRHCELKVITDGAIPSRRYHNWSMAYLNPRRFLRDQVEAITARR